MKKFLVFIAIAVASSVAASAQVKDNAENSLSYTSREPVENIVMGMKYKEIKKLYNHKEYTETLEDRYSPGWSGAASFFIPGLGQMISREVGRGFAWLGGAAACSLVYGLGTGLELMGEEDGNSKMENTGTILSMAGSLALITVDVWAIVDAVRVAKKKNMYEQDLRKTYAIDVDVNLHPSVNYIQTANGAQPTAGFTLAMKF